MHHFTAHNLFHSCLTRILRDLSCICLYAFCLGVLRITQTHSTFSSQPYHDALLQHSGFFFFLIHKGSGNTEPLHAFSALDLNPSSLGSRRHQPLNVNAAQCVRWLVWCIGPHTVLSRGFQLLEMAS